jgi:hypothetical protein
MKDMKKEKLNENGRIVFHDSNLISKEHAISFSKGCKWNGDVFRTIISINAIGDFTIQTALNLVAWDEFVG